MLLIGVIVIPIIIGLLSFEKVIRAWFVDAANNTAQAEPLQQTGSSAWSIAFGDFWDAISNQGSSTPSQGGSTDEFQRPFDEGSPGVSASETSEDEQTDDRTWRQRIQDAVHGVVEKTSEAIDNATDLFGKAARNEDLPMWKRVLAGAGYIGTVPAQIIDEFLLKDAEVILDRDATYEEKAWVVGAWAAGGAIGKAGTKIIAKGGDYIAPILRGGKQKLDEAYDAVMSAMGRTPKPKRPLWGTWDDYPKRVVDGTTYADIDGRLYTRHAVDRMRPGTYQSPGPAWPKEKDLVVPGGPRPQAGRGISPQWVEDTISRGKPKYTEAPLKDANGRKILDAQGKEIMEPRVEYTNGDVKVVLTRDESVVITVINTSQ
ncbi:MAG: hypothetical protein AAGF84_00265 [Planctomycetota bacterium]